MTTKRKPAKKPFPKTAATQGASGKKSVPPKDGLTDKQRVFVAEYLANGFNATQAAIAAGYSAKTADSQASRLLKVPAVAETIAAKQQQKLEKLDITAERVLAEIAKLAFFDPRKLFRDDGSLVPITELDDNTAAAIAGLDVKLMRDLSLLKKFKLADKGANLERLGRHLKLFTDKVEHSGSVAIAWVAELSDEELEAQLRSRGVKLEGK